MSEYQPDYQHIVDAALNRPAAFPLYEHGISNEVLSQILHKDLSGMYQGDASDIEEAIRLSAKYLSSIGYDVIPFEGCVTELVQGGRGLTGQAGAVIQSKEDVRNYPWETLPERYFSRFDPYFKALHNALPAGMKAVGGVGNGVFELIQDFVPMTELAYLELDEPEVFRELWGQVGTALFAIWKRFLETYRDDFALCRFGDDLGFKSSLLIKPETARTFILPEYSRIITLVHSYRKPFLLHSCGAIWELMDEIIEGCGIDAKHSNEDSIAPFTRWVDDYGERIGNFGGIDMNILCMNSEKEIKEYTQDVLNAIGNRAGIAIGSGNQIASYVPPSGFIAMTEAVREYRGF